MNSSLKCGKNSSNEELKQYQKKIISLPSYAQAAANDLETISEGGACYKPQTNWRISLQSMW